MASWSVRSLGTRCLRAMLSITNEAIIADGFDMSFICIFFNKIALIYPQILDPDQLMLANLVS